MKLLEGIEKTMSALVTRWSHDIGIRVLDFYGSRETLNTDLLGHRIS